MWNKAHYGVDCFNKVNGLPYLINLIKDSKMEKIELCLTDPSYDEGFGKNLSPIKSKTIKNYKQTQEKKRHYKDEYIDYKTFSLKWINLALECCNGIVFTSGTKHHYDLIKWKTPNYHEKYFYKPNATSYILCEPILFYGKINHYNRIRQLIEIPNEPKRHLIHPTPKPLELYFYLLKKIKPKSVLDLFLGSGSVALICERLKIKYIGYEIIKEYESDFLDRRNQKTIIDFLKNKI